MRRSSVLLLVSAAFAVAGCDLLGIESASETAARRESEGKAIGGACRHAARSIEQCYELNRRADKAAVFAGWREMNDYMRENQLEPMPAADAASLARSDAAAAGATTEAEAPAPERAASDAAHEGERAPPRKRGRTPARS